MPNPRPTDPRAARAHDAQLAAEARRITRRRWAADFKAGRVRLTGLALRAVARPRLIRLRAARAAAGSRQPVAALREAA